MLVLQQTDVFTEWLRALRDRAARTRIEVRVVGLSQGNPGQTRNLGGGLSEMKIDFGPGYRVYFMQRGTELVVLLCGGDKSSQSKDIALARRLAREWSREKTMALKTSPFGVADYLIDENEIFHYLEAELETDEPQYLAEALSAVARARGGTDHVAAESGVPIDSLANAGALDHVSVRELTIQVMGAYRQRMSSDSRVA